MSATPSVEPSISTSTQPRARTGGGWTTGRIISLVAGCIVALIALGLLGAGSWATWQTNQRDASGYLNASKHTIATGGYVISTNEVSEIAGQSWSDLLGKVRVRATSTDPTAGVFIGVAPKSSVDSYLSGVDRKVVTGWFPFKTRDQRVAGAAPKTGPIAVPIWTHQVSGTGTQSLAWSPASDSTVVVMQPNAAAGVSVTADIGAQVPDLPWFAVGFLVAGVLALGVGVVLVAVSAARASR